MSQPDQPSGGRPPRLPPDVPEEYADAFRRGYERAWATSHGAAPPPAEADPYEDLFADVEPATWDRPTHREPVRPQEPRWFLGLLVGFVVLALVISAYGLGRLFSVGSDSSEAPVVETPHAQGTSARQPPKETPRAEPSPTLPGSGWDGDVAMVTDLTARSGCAMPPGTDAAGRVVDYEPDRAVDGDFTTAWRCAGDGRGVTLDVALAQQARIGQVGLVAGYAKTDPQTGADRYAENNRLTRVRWSFGDGRSVVQQLDGSPDNRGVQTMRIPPVKTDSVVLELLDSVPGPRNAVAISEVALGRAVG